MSKKSQALNKDENALKSESSKSSANVNTKRKKKIVEDMPIEQPANAEKDKPKKSSRAKNKTAEGEQPAVESESKPKKKEKSDEVRKVCKTPQVMKLVERTKDINPVLLAGKSRVPVQLRGKESLTRIMRRGLGEEFYDDDDETVVVNITEIAIQHEAPIILDRFNACSCDKCVEIFSKIIAERVPVRFARVNKNGRGTGNRELSERVAPMKKMVLTEMIKELIGSKKRCFHNDNV